MTDKVRFVHLRTRSRYSLLDGLLSPVELINWAVAEKMPAIALADDQNLFGVVEFSLAGNKSGVQPLLAAAVDLTAEIESNHTDGRSSSVVLIVQNAKGYENLNKIVTQLYMPIAEDQVKGFQQMRLSLADIERHAEGLILLTGGIGAPLGQMLVNGADQDAEAWLKRAQKAFSGRLFVEMQRHDLADEAIWEEKLVALADRVELPLVATNDCRFLKADQFKYHDALRAVAGGEKVAQAEKRKRLNSSYYLRSTDDMQARFSDVPDALENTLAVAKLCRFTLQDMSKTPRLPSIRSLEEGTSADALLVENTRKGLAERLAERGWSIKDEQASAYLERMETELGIIQQSGFAGYFLIVEDFIRHARENNIAVGPGRGSGVGSLVAWSLKITALDPLRWGLLFERFLNAERISVPDFDIDFCTEKREQVIEYVRETYGEDSVSQIITFGKLRSRGALRDIGRVLGLPYGAVDQLCKMLPKEDVANPQSLSEIYEQEPPLRKHITREEELVTLWEYAVELEGCYRHASTHAAGVVIADRSLIGEVALYFDPKSKLKATQLDMKSSEKAGLVKFDFLGLSTVTILTHAAENVERLYEKKINFDTISLDDQAVYAVISQGHTDGIFQLESPGMRRVAVQLRPDCFADIVAMVALFRPGPMDNIPRFIRCKHGEEEIRYPHPLLEGILKETYGIAVYQEQIMQMCQALAGFGLGKADQVRRAMGKKNVVELEAFRQEFIDEAFRLHQINRGEGENIFETILAFAAYGFNKSHSAAYALVAYWTGWLKVHYSDCFMVALLNNALQTPNNIAQYILECKRLEIEVLALDINLSSPRFSIERPNQIRYGLGGVRGVGEEIMIRVCAERDEGGEFEDLADFARRTKDIGLNRKTLEALITAGAFDRIIPNRQSAYLLINPMIEHARHCREVMGEENVLFTPELPEAPTMKDVGEWEGHEFFAYEFVALGFHFSGHPLDLYKQHIQDVGVTAYTDLHHFIGERGTARIAGFMYDSILTKTRPRAKGKGKIEEPVPLLILKFSDSQSRFNVNFEGQELIDQVKTILEETPLLMMDVQARFSQGIWNFRAFHIHPLGSSTPDKEEAISLQILDIDDLPMVHGLLTQAEASEESIYGAKVELLVHTKEGHAVIPLKQRYQISLEHRRALSALENVKLRVRLRDPFEEELFKPHDVIDGHIV